MNPDADMFFDDYRLHKDAKIRNSLLWEYDMTHFDWNSMRTVVVQRVVERGRRNDFYALLNMYGPEGVKEGIKDIPSMNPLDMSFVCKVFGIKKEELKCYTLKRSRLQHWNSSKD